jgi:hypothetical protein
MAASLVPVSLEAFQSYLFQKRDEGLRFAPAAHSIDTDGDDLYSYHHPETGEVCAMVEVARDEQGIALDSQKVFYVLR